MTPRETWAVIRSRSTAERRRAVYLAWHVAAFERTDRLPGLAEVVARVSGDAETEQSPEAQLAAARRIAAALGATEAS